MSPARSPLIAAAVDRTPLDLGAEPAQAAASGGGGGIARMVIGLVVVVAAIWALRWVLEQVRAAREGQSAGAGLRALASLPLGPNRSVHLVRAGHELVLLGVAEQGVTPIRTYSEQEARAAGLLDEDGGTEPVAAASLLAGLRERTVRR
jgi:flagellar protein FliO/FliZ